MPFSTYTALMLNTTSNVLSNKDGRIRRHSELAFGHCAWARYSRDSNVITVFVHIPTLRIRAGCQCPPCTRSWPGSPELMGTGSTSFLSLRDNVLFCILCYTPFPMTSDRAKLSKYVHNRNSKWNFIPMRVVYHIQSIIDDFCPSLFPDCEFPLPYFDGFYFILPLIIWSLLLLFYNKIQSQD